MAQDNRDLIPLFYAAGEKYNIDPDLLMALAKQESGMNVGTRDSYQGAQGLMQILPSTAKGLGISDARDPIQAIPAAASYLREGFDKMGTPQGALMYYHGGPDTSQWGPKTRAYVPAVTGHYMAMKQDQGDTASKYDDLIKKYGTPSSSASPTADVPSGANDYGSLIEKYGTPSKAPLVGENPEDAGQRSIAQSVADQVSGKIPAVGATASKDDSPTWAGKLAAAIDPYTVAANFFPRIPPAIVANAQAGATLAGQGKQEMLAGNYAPSFPTSDPSSWAPGGVLKTLGGYGAALMAGPNALVQEGVEKPITALTGNPDVGQRAGIVASSLIPVGTGGAVNRLVGPEARAGREINRLVTPDVAAELQRNPSLSLMDVSPEAQFKAIGLARQAEGPSQEILSGAVADRAANAASRSRGALDSVLGPQQDLPTYLTGLEKTAQANAQKGFGAALSGAKRVDLTGLPQPYLQKISDVMDRLKAENLDWDKLSQPEQLHKIQSDMGREATNLSTSASGADREAARSIMNARSQLVNRIDQATGGQFKPAQAQFAEDKSVRAAFDKGRTIFNAGQDLENHPQFWRDAVAGLSPPEKQALELGVRTAADAKLGATRRPGTAGANTTGTEWNQDKLAAVVGPDEANRLTKLFQDESKIAETNQKITQNSITALAGQAIPATAIREKQPLLGSLGGTSLPAIAAFSGHADLAPAAALAGAGKWAYNSLGRVSDAAKNRLIAEILSAPGMTGVNRIGGSVNPLIPYQLPAALGAGTYAETPPPYLNPLLR